MATSSPGAVWLPFRHRGAWTLLTALLLAAAHDGAVVGGAEAAGPDDGRGRPLLRRLLERS